MKCFVSELPDDQEQSLIFRRRTLTDDRTLISYNIQTGSTLRLSLPMTILVTQLPRRNILHVTVDAYDTIDTVKMKMERLTSKSRWIQHFCK